jgi:hypothetical protein
VNNIFLTLSDITVFLSLQIVGHRLPYDSLHEIRHRLDEVSPNLTRYGEVEEANYFKQAADLSKVCTACCEMDLTCQYFLKNVTWNVSEK